MDSQLKIQSIFMRVIAGGYALATLAWVLYIGLMVAVAGTMILLDPQAMGGDAWIIAVYGGMWLFYVVDFVITVGLGAVIWFGAVELQNKGSLARVYLALVSMTLIPVVHMALALLTCQCTQLMAWLPLSVLTLMMVIWVVVVLSDPDMREQFEGVDLDDTPY